MHYLRSVVLLVCAVGSANAQATTRPTTEVAGTVVRTPGADLVIDSLDVRMATGIMADVDATRNSVQINGLVLVARVTNRGTERWAAPRGAIGFALKAGREEDEAAGARPRGGVSTVPGQTSGLARAITAPFGPFRAEAPVPGSLAPGESRVITVVLKNRNENAFVIFERDKYYTLIATLRTRGDVNGANNRSERVGRFDASRDRLITRWEPLKVVPPSGGTVQVNAPPRPPQP